MGTLTGGGATHPLSSTASATAKAAKKARPRINIGTPQKNLLPKYRRCELQIRTRRFKPLVVPVGRVPICSAVQPTDMVLNTRLSDSYAKVILKEHPQTSKFPVSAVSADAQQTQIQVGRNAVFVTI
jgi:hypothetical protein